MCSARNPEITMVSQTHEFDVSRLLEHISTERIYDRLDRLSEIGKTSDDGVSRLAYTQTENDAFEFVREELPPECSIETDPFGNLFATSFPNAEQSVYTGSHLDTVYNGGWLDGALGVVVSMEVVNAVVESSVEPPIPPKMAVFRAEESARFGHHTIGSRAVFGQLDSETLASADQNDIPLWQAMNQAGFHPESLSVPSVDGSDMSGFVEIHIEQGRVLEQHNNELGIVSSIRAPVRHKFTVTGDYDHSGATPMDMRWDALAAAAAIIVAVEQTVTKATADGDIVGTVGEITAVDGAVNQVCGEAEFSIDLRSTDQAYRDTVEEAILEEADRIAQHREVSLESTVIDRTAPVDLDSEMIARLRAAAETIETDFEVMPSGGGHDAMNFQKEGVPAGMVFVPSIDGVSHNPSEETTKRAVREATLALAQTLVGFEGS